jgi:hypothetical protein
VLALNHCLYNPFAALTLVICIKIDFLIAAFVTLQIAPLFAVVVAVFVLVVADLSLLDNHTVH